MSSNNIGKSLQQIQTKLELACKKNGFQIYFKKIGFNLISEGTQGAINEKKNDRLRVKVSNFCDELDNVWMYSQIIFEQIEATKYKKEELKEEIDFYKNNSLKIDGGIFKISISVSIYEGIANEVWSDVELSQCLSSRRGASSFAAATNHEHAAFTKSINANYSRRVGSKSH